MPARYEMLAAWANSRGWKAGAELGIFNGATHLYLLRHCPQLKLIGVDVWDLPGFKEGTTKSGERCFCQYCGATRKASRAETKLQMRLRVAQETGEFGGRSTLLQMPTYEAARLVPDKGLDFVFVDGDHSSEGVSRDIADWHPKVKPGGSLIGHDFNMRSVADAVLARFERNQIVLSDDHLWRVQV